VGGFVLRTRSPTPVSWSAFDRDLEIIANLAARASRRSATAAAFDVMRDPSEHDAVGVYAPN
jgi:hypothetical protein